jgi:hypothetical protein
MTQDTTTTTGEQQTVTGGHVIKPGTDIAALEIPTLAEVAQIVGAQPLDVRGWIAALAAGEQFEETDTEDAAASIVRAILTAGSVEEMFGAMSVTSVKEMLGDEPGAASNVFEIYQGKPLASTFDEGPSCFAVFKARDLAEGTPCTLSCGARAIQAAFLAALINGWLPLRGRFVRRRKPTRRGFYPINLEQGI